MKNLKITLSVFLILVVTFICFYPSLKNGFINWDDPQYVLRNPTIKDISWANIQQAFSQFFVGHYQPFTQMSFMLDYRLFGLNPYGYHLTNLIFHLFNCVFVFWLIFLLTKKNGVALISAILFAIHPLRVESVAWISERKDVLYVFFFLAALICYVFYLQKHHKARYYFFSVFLFVFSLLSKVMAVSLPLVLLLIDYFTQRKRDKSMLIDKTPFFILSFIFVMIKIILAFLSGALRNAEEFNFFAKIGVNIYIFVFYLFKIFVPLKLSGFYEYLDMETLFSNQVLLYTFLVIFVLLYLILLSAGYIRKTIFGSLWFVIIVSPTLLFLSTGTVSADRYTYLGSLGIFYLIAEGFIWLFSKKFKDLYIMRFFLFIALAGAICTLSMLTWNRCKVWKDSISFWNDVLNKYPNGSDTIYNNIGYAYNESGEYELAGIMFQRAIKINPDFAMAYVNLGNSYRAMGKTTAAMNAYEKAIATDINLAEAYFNLGILYGSMDKTDAAVSVYKRAIKIIPDFTEAYYALGVLYNNIHKKAEAMAMFEKTIEYNPDHLSAYLNLVNIYRELGKENEVILLYRKAISRNLDVFSAYYYMGNLYADTQKDKDAILSYLRAVQIRPDAKEAYLGLGSAYLAVGKNKEAIIYLEKAIKLDPGFAVAHNNIALAYYYAKKYDLAVEHCDRAQRLGYQPGLKLLELLKPYRRK